MVWNIYGPDVKLIPISLKYSIFALNLHLLVSKQSMHQDRQKRTSDNRDKFFVVKFLKLQSLFSKQSMHHLVWQLVKGGYGELWSTWFLHQQTNTEQTKENIGRKRKVHSSEIFKIAIFGFKAKYASSCLAVRKGGCRELWPTWFLHQKPNIGQTKENREY